MALKLKYKDEHGILHINMSPSSSPSPTVGTQDTTSDKTEKDADIDNPKFDTINNRFGQYDLFGGKYEKFDDKSDSSGESNLSNLTKHSLFRSRYNSIEEELANTPYAFATERTIRFNAHSPLLDITIARGTDASPSKDIEDDRFFHRSIDLFGPSIDESIDLDTAAFTVTQLIHAQDRYFDLSSRQSEKSGVKSDRTGVREDKEGRTEEKKKEDKKKNEAFKVLSTQTRVKSAQTQPTPPSLPVVPTAKRKREKSFAILADKPSRPASPRSLPVEIKPERISPFRGRGFREETSRHTTPRTSAANSRAGTPPPRRRTCSLTRLDTMAAATLPPPLPPIQISHPHTPRDFVKENIEEVRELSELNREKNEAEAEKKRLEEEEALLKEMGLLDKNAKSDAIRSVVCSRTNSRSSSPNKGILRSRSNSPTAPSILRFENLQPEKIIVINQNDGMSPVTHRSRSVSRSQPPSNEGSPKHSKIPKRQSSVSPNRKNVPENGLRKNQRFISNSTSSIHETIRVGGHAHDKRGISKSTQFLNISPAHIRGKPPISPSGRVGPPPSNRAINAKRLSPIVGTPNKSPTGDKPTSARTPTKPSSLTRKPVKTAGNTPATSRFNSRQPSRNVSRDSSPEKNNAKSAMNKYKPVARAVSTRTTAKPDATKPVARNSSLKGLTRSQMMLNKTDSKKPVANKNGSLKSLTRTQMMLNKVEPKKPVVSRNNSLKTLTRTQIMLNKNEPKKPAVSRQSSLKNLTKSQMSLNNKTDSKKPPKPPVSRTSSMKSLTKSTMMLNKRESNNDMSKSANDLDAIEPDGLPDKTVEKPIEKVENETTKHTGSSSEESPSVTKQDMHTQYDKITNDKGELVIMTKRNIVSMTTAAITSQPLEVVTKVTNQLPVSLEKAKERGIFNSKDSLGPKEEDKPKAVFTEENVKLKPLLPPYNNPQVERVKQKIDDILKSPEVSTENIATSASKTKEKNTFKNIADKTKTDISDAKKDAFSKFSDLKSQMEKAAIETANAEKAAVEHVQAEAAKAEKAVEKTAEEIRSEASKIVDSIMTPIEEPKSAQPKEESKKDIEPTIVVVNEKTNGPKAEAILEKMTETLVKGEPDLEVQSSNISSPGVDKMQMAMHKKTDGSESDKSAQSNGGFPQSTSTTPKPPARTKRDSKDGSKSSEVKEISPEPKPQNFCQRLMGKCKQCCACCAKPKGDKEMDEKMPKEEKRGLMSRLNCCKKSDRAERDAEMAAGKATIEFESETKRKRKLRDVMCGCCGRRRRVSDVSRDVSGAYDVTAPADAGCCGRQQAVERRDSILSDRPPASWCSRLGSWVRGSCRRQQPEPVSASRRQSLFSKNKSLSPTLPPEDTRTKLDASLVEHTSLIRGAVPVLPSVLAYICLVCNILVPGLGSIFSGMFCLCFGIPRFGVHDGAKYRIGSFIINLLVGCLQLFTVLFCLVGWGWSIWWGVIMVRIARKYRKLKAEAAAAAEAEAPPVTANNHTRA